MENFAFICIVFTTLINLNCGNVAASSSDSEYHDAAAKDYSSSVFCHTINGSLSCTFTNLCYSSETNQFAFTLTDRSIFYGLRSKEDLKLIQLSSALNHNSFPLNVAIVTPENAIFSRPTVRHGAVFLLSRFKYDNIMHVIHDDLFPLFFTYLVICEASVDSCSSMYQLAFVDGGNEGAFDELYMTFSKTEPLFLSKQDNESLICFSKAHAGLIRTTVWFQYGFGIPQGPHKDTMLQGSMLQEFKNYIIRKLNIKQNAISSNKIVLLSRNVNRKILNEDYLVTTLINSYNHHYVSSQVKVIKVDVSTHNISSLLETVLATRIVVGMHGSAMILCLFLPPGSVVVELFPFGISANHVSHIKALSELPGVGIIYRSWENQQEANSVPHPAAPPLLGGIEHLSPGEQEEIKKTKLVPAVHCCHNALYLYRMFQDTSIGEDFVQVFEDAIQEQTAFSIQTFQAEYINSLWSKWYYPAPVTNIQCIILDRQLKISWSEPVNIQQPSMVYEIACIVDKGQSLSTRSTTPYLYLQVPLGRTEISADIWVKVVSAFGESSDTYFKCSAQCPNS